MRKKQKCRSKHRKIRIRDAVYKIVYTHDEVPMDADGIIDYDTRTIRIRPDLTGNRRREILFHEFLHARYPKMPELEVKHAAINLCNLLRYDKCPRKKSR